MPASYNTVSVQTSATLILAANNDRRGLIVYNNGNNTMYIGLDAAVTTSTGIPILPQSSFELNGDKCWRGAVYGIAVTSSDDCRYWEWLC